MNISLTTAKNDKFLLHFVILHYNYSKCYITFLLDLYFMLMYACCVSANARYASKSERYAVSIDFFICSIYNIDR